MGHQYAGDDTSFPIDFTVPDDGDLDDAAVLAIPPEALGDRTAWLRKWVLTLPALNFLRPFTVTIMPTLVKYDPHIQGWLAVGSAADTFFRTQNPGAGFEHWNSSTEFTGGNVLGVGSCFDFAIRTTGTGDILALQDGGANYWYFNSGLGTWSHGLYTGAQLSKPCVVYEPVTDHYVSVHHDGAGTVAADYVTTPLTIHVATAPSGFVSGANSGITLGVDGIGNTVAVNFDAAGNTIKFSLSTDGGVTWGAVSSQGLGFSPRGNIGSQGRFCFPQWNGKYWMVYAADASSANSVVFTSPDGITWTQVSAQVSGTSHVLQGLAVIGELWLSWDIAWTSGIGGRCPTYSVDKGVTWHTTDQAFGVATYPFFLASNGRRFLLGGASNTVWASIAVGGGF